MSTESSVINRYSSAAINHEQNLCCPVENDTKYLKIIPDEIIEKDYGCGDPLGKIKEGDTVLDLGSGGGKVPYIVSQIVGQTGTVIGVDMNENMLALAKKY
ncbi:methyltransferase domain-containing protein [Virgibacillus alimentarius]|uniref:tRNA A58 N-methylase Trm61 n=1 Tax=Virgibacillus alimentarius TaxID=698769 RepID=A0ABS4SCD6_9BACI|nr:MULTISPECIES: methyltransferase domain-containing protein [Virgibacillus]MBP2259074.1 tRNA A58 N-methylase Trm61 [Virgibacillus alimentarius]HLR68159.1 methyltransferase domain-containing protein [Virgibacillus sp.]